ncbi:MAG TPA: PAS domain S-box protein [Anaeromyxobacteraceae bacterium]
MEIPVPQIDSYLASAAFSSMLFVALGFAWRTYRQRYLVYWAAYWGLYSVIWPCIAFLEARAGAVPPNDPVAVALDALTMLCGLAARLSLAFGVLAYLGRPLPARRVRSALAAGATAFTAASTVAHVLATSHHAPAWVGAPFHAYVVGVPLYLALAVVAWVASRRHSHAAPRRLLAAATLAGGLSDLWDVYLNLRAAAGGWLTEALALRLSAFGTHAADALMAVAMMVAAIGEEWTRAEGAAAQLRRSEARLRSLFENALDVIAVVDLQGTLRFASPSAPRVLGQAPGSLLGSRVLELVHPEDREAAAAMLRQVLERPEVSHLMELRLRRGDGSYAPVEVVGQLRELEPGDRAVVLAVRDVSERRTLESRLQQSQRLETIGRLAGGVAHDFNNLLTAVLANLQMLEGSLPPDHPGRAELQDASLAAERATRLTRQLLTFARRQVVAPRVLDLNEVVASMDRMVGRLIGEHIGRRVRLGPGLWPVRVDPTQLEQLLVNLVVNARDAMGSGGMLLVETGNASLGNGLRAADEIDVPAGDWVRLVVEDTGHGMDEATLGRIFEPFFTTKEPGQGTGLGLATVHGIVQQAGGHVRVRSAPGAGARFAVWFPRHHGAPAPAVADAREPAAGGNETILLAEDEPQVRAIAARVLSGRGYVVLQASDGAQALRAAAAHAGPIHLLVTDVVMPELGGRDLAERLAADRPGLRVLFTSGYTAGGLAEGAAFLPKPFTPDQLASRVRELLDEVLPVNPRS